MMRRILQMAIEVLMKFARSDGVPQSRLRLMPIRKNPEPQGVQFRHGNAVRPNELELHWG